MVFGSGGALLQKVDRDTQKCAFKCSFAVVDGKPVSAWLTAGIIKDLVCGMIIWLISTKGGGAVA